MAKKKGKKGKSKKKGAPKKTGPVSTYTPIDVPNDDENIVTLQLKLINWTFQNFTIKVKTSTPLFSIANKLRQRHGKLRDLRLYKDTVNDDNILDGEFSSLHELGIQGSKTGDANCVIYYDFKPENVSDPLLLASMNKDTEIIPAT